MHPAPIQIMCATKCVQHEVAVDMTSRDRIPEGLASCYLEGENTGVYIVVRSIIECGYYIYDGKAGKSPTAHHFFQTLGYSRDVFLGYLRKSAELKFESSEVSFLRIRKILIFAERVGEPVNSIHCHDQAKVQMVAVVSALSLHMHCSKL